MTLPPRSAALLVLFAAPSPAAQHLPDGGPVWAGVTDTTSLGDRVRGLLAESDALLDGVRAVSGERTAENTLVPYKHAGAALSEAEWLATMGLNAHSDSVFRAYAQAWQTRLSARQAALATDRTVYEALASIDLARLGAADRYRTERALAAYRRDGVDLDAPTRERLQALRAQITDLGTRFEQNVYRDDRTIRVHPDSLRGVPADWIAAHASGEPDADGLVAVTLTQANQSALATYAESATVREQRARAHYPRGYPQNVPLIDSLRALRHEVARLLGYDSWAAYSLEPTMAGSPDRVARFLDEVDAASAGPARREAEALRAIREEEAPGSPALNAVHEGYWTNRLKQRDYGFDEQAMREYFPYAAVRDGILSAYAEMFGLEFRPAPAMAVWSADAEPYEVYEDGALVGRFTLDMHPREGKFGWFRMSALRLGTGELPEAALLCNFPRPSGDDPGLLTPGQVGTFFHEFGHLIHFLSAGQQPVLALSDFEWDFVEAPSQLLEEWARDADVLQRFARHHETGEPIPADLVAAYRRADAFGRGIGARYGLWYSSIALGLYRAPPEADPTADVEARAAGALALPMPDFYRPSTTLTHLNSYSSNYYTYTWSEVIARDLLTGFDRSDLLDPEVGARYRDLVLARTGTAPSGELVERFLGRPFNADAWRAWLNEGL